MRSSTPTRLCPWCTCMHIEVYSVVYQTIQSFFIIPKLCTVFKLLAHWECVCVCITSNILWFAWYLPDNHTKFHKDPSSPSWNIKVSLLPQVACTFLLIVCEQAHVYAHEHYQSTQEINLNICSRFHENPTWFSWLMRVCYFVTCGQTRCQTDASQIYYIWESFHR